MKFSELKKYLSSCVPAGFFFAEGDDGFLREKACFMLIEKAVTDFPEMNLSRLENPSVREIAESCCVLPFLGGKRAVFIKEYYPKASDAEELMKIPDNPDCALIISNSQKSEISKRLTREITYIDCGREDVPVLVRWITGIAGGRGAAISPDAAEKLAVYCGRDMARITGEIEKLSQGSKEITGEDIEENVFKDMEYQVYMLANAVASKDGNAYMIIKDYALKGDSNYVQQLLSSLYSQYKRMFYIKDSHLPQSELSRLLGIKPYAVQMSAKTAKRYSKKQLMAAMETCAKADYDIKSGKCAGETALMQVTAKLINQ